LLLSFPFSQRNPVTEGFLSHSLGPHHRFRVIPKNFLFLGPSFSFIFSGVFAFSVPDYFFSRLHHLPTFFYYESFDDALYVPVYVSGTKHPLDFSRYSHLTQFEVVIYWFRALAPCVISKFPFPFPEVLV